MVTSHSCDLCSNIYPKHVSQFHGWKKKTYPFSLFCCFWHPNQCMRVHCLLEKKDILPYHYKREVLTIKYFVQFIPVCCIFIAQKQINWWCIMNKWKYNWYFEMYAPKMVQLVHHGNSVIVLSFVSRYHRYRERDPKECHHYELPWRAIESFFSCCSAKCVWQLHSLHIWAWRGGGHLYSKVDMMREQENK